MLQLEREIKKYSTAFLDVLSAKGLIEEVDNNMKQLKDFFVAMFSSQKSILEYKELTNKFSMLSHKKKLALVNVAMDKVGANKILKNFVLLLLVSKRINLLRHIVLNWDQIVFDYKGFVRVSVTSVMQLDSNQEEAINTIMQKKFANKYYLEKKINKSILGGLLIEFNSQVIDDTLESKLLKIKNDIKGIY